MNISPSLADQWDPGRYPSRILSLPCTVKEAAPVYPGKPFPGEVPSRFAGNLSSLQIPPLPDAGFQGSLERCVVHAFDGTGIEPFVF